MFYMSKGIIELSQVAVLILTKLHTVESFIKASGEKKLEPSEAQTFVKVIVPSGQTSIKSVYIYTLIYHTHIYIYIYIT